MYGPSLEVHLVLEVEVQSRGSHYCYMPPGKYLKYRRGREELGDDKDMSIAVLASLNLQGRHDPNYYVGSQKGSL